MLQEGEDVVPADRVKGLGDIKFYEEHRGPVSVESPCHIAHVKKVVVDTAAANKALWLLEMICSIAGARRSAMTLASNFAMLWMRLIGR